MLLYIIVCVNIDALVITGQLTGFEHLCGYFYPDRGLYSDSSFHPNYGLFQSGSDSGLHPDGDF